MNGITINTEDTVILNLLVVEEICINATGAKLRQSTFFPVGLHFRYVNEPRGRSQPLLDPSSFLIQPTRSD